MVFVYACVSYGEILSLVPYSLIPCHIPYHQLVISTWNHKNMGQFIIYKPYKVKYPFYVGYYFDLVTPFSLDLFLILAVTPFVYAFISLGCMSPTLVSISLYMFSFLGNMCSSLLSLILVIIFYP